MTGDHAVTSHTPNIKPNADSTETARYDAFISYRNGGSDERWARWLENELETYRPPRSVNCPRRGLRIFRDDDDLAAVPNLGAKIEQTLRDTRYMILVCSPRTTQSDWVNREVAFFAELHGWDRILALLIEGDPAASFPPALRDRHPAESQPFDSAPLAADLRPRAGESQRERLKIARLRIAATLLGVGYDELRQKDHERQLRRLAWLGAAMCLLLVVLSALTIIALGQRRIALAQKDLAKQAEARARTALARNLVQQGNVQIDAHNPAMALLYYTRALAAARNGTTAPDDEESYRRRIASTLRITPRPVTTDRKRASPPRFNSLARHDRREVIINEKQKNEADVFDSQSHEHLAGPMRHRAEIKHAIFSPDGRWIATTSEDWTARIWDSRTGKPFTPPLQHGYNVWGAMFSHDLTRLVTCSSDGTARVWDVGGDPITPPLKHNSLVWYAAFSPDDRCVVTGSNDKTARVWQADSGYALYPLIQREGDIFYADFDGSSERIITGTRDDTPRVYDLNGVERPMARLRLPNWEPESADVVVPSSDSRHILGFTPGRTAPAMWDLSTNQRIPVPPRIREFEFGFTWVGWSGGGKRLVVAAEDGTVSTLDLVTGRTIAILFKGKGRPAAVSADQRRVAMIDAKYESVQTWDMPSNKPVGPAMHFDTSVSRAILDKHGKHIAIIGFSNWIEVHDTASGANAVPALKDPLSGKCGAFSPDARFFAAGEEGGATSVWSLADGSKRCTTSPLHRWVESVEFSPDGKWIATSSGEEARVWEAQTGMAVTPPLRQADSVMHVTFTPDATRLLVATFKSGVAVWDITPDARPVADLIKYAEVASSHRLDETGALLPLSPAQWNERFNDLRARYPAWFAPAPASTQSASTQPASAPDESQE